MAVNSLKHKSFLKILTGSGIWWWFRAAVTVGLAAYLIYRLRDQFQALTLQIAHPANLIVATALAILGVLISTQLWKLFIPNCLNVPFRHLLAHYLVGMLWNNFLPGGIGGDAARVVALRRTTGKVDIAVSTVLMTRLAGLWSIVLLALLAAVIHAIYRGIIQSMLFILLSIGATVITACVTLFLLGHPLEKITRHFPPSWLGWQSQLQEYAAKPNQLLKSLGYGLAVQVSAVFINYFIAQALNLPISAWHLWLSVPLITLLTMLPISIGGFGVREGAYAFLLGLFGLAAADAVILSLAVYILLALVTAIGAGISLVLEPISMKAYIKAENYENPDY